MKNIKTAAILLAVLGVFGLSAIGAQTAKQPSPPIDAGDSTIPVKSGTLVKGEDQWDVIRQAYTAARTYGCFGYLSVEDTKVTVPKKMVLGQRSGQLADAAGTMLRFL